MKMNLNDIQGISWSSSFTGSPSPCRADVTGQVSPAPGRHPTTGQEAIILRESTIIISSTSTSTIIIIIIIFVIKFC